MSCELLLRRVTRDGVCPPLLELLLLDRKFPHDRELTF